MNSFVSVIQDESINTYSDYSKIKSMVKEALNNYLISVYGNNDLTNLIKPGMNVVIKPNLVHELNFLVKFDGVSMDDPNDCFITNWSVIKAIIEIISDINDISITICECPLQSCAIDKIVSNEMLTELESACNVRINFIDARRTKYIYGKKQPTVLHDLRSEDFYVDVDLGLESAHAQYDDKVDRFRVTDYPPDEMKRFHKKGKHIYRIAREIMEANVIFSVPKLKTHMKAGMTNAMKNFVGVVGNKECLPHHIKGSCYSGGDNYGDISLIKFFAENLIDKANSYLLNDEKKYYRMRKVVNLFLLMRKVLCLDQDITGSWYGNDTISRTVVDLNRIVYFGSNDGKMHNLPQRKVVSIVDAIVSGQGEGPMRPQPNYTGFIAVSESTAAIDAVCAELIGLNFEKIHYLFEDRVVNGRYPLTSPFSNINIIYNGHLDTFDFVRKIDRNIIVPPRWNGKIEKKPQSDFKYTTQFLQNVKNYHNMVSNYLQKK